jgi:hypothetical protein
LCKEKRVSKPSILLRECDANEDFHSDKSEEKCIKKIKRKRKREKEDEEWKEDNDTKKKVFKEDILLEHSMRKW